MNKLTKAQVEMMRDFDGMMGTKSYPGTSIPTARILAGMGLVTYRKVKTISNVRGFGDFPRHSQRVRVNVTVTQEGADFIFNGGLDKSAPSV